MTISRITHIKELKNAVPQADSAILQRIGDTDSYTTVRQIEEWIAPAKQADFLKRTGELAEADSTEKAARENADTTLQSNIDAEATARQSADTTLQGQITSLDSRQTASENAIDVLNGTGEGSVAKTVSDRITELVAGAPEALDTLKEISDWIGGHESSAAEMNSAIQTNAANISKEISDRQLDTVTLQGSIADETLARESADETLQANINSEASVRESADDTLRADLGSEESARITADETLQSNIDNEASARGSADTTLQSNIDALSGRLDEEKAARENGDADTLANLTETFGEQVAGIANDKVDEVINERMLEYDTAIESHGTSIETMGAAIQELQSGKQNKLTFDSTPTSGSSNPVTSGGIAAAIANAKNSVTSARIPDTRGDNQTPEWYFKNYPNQVVHEFKFCNAISLSVGATYCDLETIVYWSDASGGYPIQTARYQGNCYVRYGTSATAWSAWAKKW